MHKYSVLNLTKHILIASEIDSADRCSSRMKGLLGRSAQQFAYGQGLWIVPCQGIHTIGMSFPIDVAYLDASGCIMHLYHRLAPFRLAALKLRAQGMLGLPAGTLSSSGTNIGDILEFRSSNHAKPQSP